MNLLSDFPSKNELSAWWQKRNKETIHKVNCHIHTPYSFSAFSDIAQIFDLAVKENIKVLGINDFFVTDGYEEFNRFALKNKVFPEFNIEFVGLLKEELVNGIKVNDPNNPGRTYFSGKGLSFPFSASEKNLKKIQQVKTESQKQAIEMLEKTNTLLKQINSPFTFNFEQIKNEFAKELVRERHIAKALRVKINEHFQTRPERKAFLEKLYSGKEQKVDLSNNTLLEEEIRGNLLKAGGAAYVPEDEKAFLPIPEIIKIIIDAGGIPCYPVLLDDKNGNYTQFEENANALCNRLNQLGVGCLELIPVRNKFENLEKFVKVAEEKGFLIQFGTEHNSPKLIPLTVKTRDGAYLNSKLKEIAYEGACVVAAHQYLIAKSMEGYIDASGYTKSSEKNEFIDLGKAVIEYYLSRN